MIRCFRCTECCERLRGELTMQEVCEGYHCMKIPSCSVRGLNIHRFLMPLRLPGTNAPVDTKDWLLMFVCYIFYSLGLRQLDSNIMKLNWIRWEVLWKWMPYSVKLFWTWTSFLLMLIPSAASEPLSYSCSLACPFHQPKHLLFLPFSVSSFDIFFTLKFTKLFFSFLRQSDIQAWNSL